jgi:hypothetical protein
MAVRRGITRLDDSEERAMTQTIPIRLWQGEVDRQARKFFGPQYQGLDLTVDEPGHLRFEGDGGFVELTIRPASNNQVRLTIANQGFEQEIKEFRQRLARQAAAETSTSD